MPYQPTLKSSKRSMVVSGNSVMRERDPPNPGLQAKLPGMVWDHSSQMAIVPKNFLGHGLARKNADPNALASASTTMNSNGRSATPLDVEVGGSEDPKGTPRPTDSKLKRERY